MFKAIRKNKVKAISDNSPVFLMVVDEVVEDKEHTCKDYELYNDEYILKSEYPVEARNEQIRAERQRRYEEESDPIRLDYDEALARGEETAETLKQEWLASKDKIREELPYIVG